MHILYLVDFYKPNIGGIEILMEELIQYFGKENKISVITWKFDKKLESIEKKGNITVYRIDAKNLIFYTFIAYKFAKKIISDVDIIHANNFYSAIVGSKLSKKYKKKSILHIHGFFGQLRNKLLEGNFLLKKVKVWKFQFLERLNIYGNFDKYICVSKYVLDVAKFYYGIDDDKLELVYNGLNYKKWEENINEEEIKNIKSKYNLENIFSLLFYGRIEKVKGIDIFLEVLTKIKFKTKVVFILHGDMGKFIEKIKSLGGKIQDNNYILNNVEIIILEKIEHSKIGNYIKAVNGVVFPSITESFGYVGLETSILQTPIIASNNGAIPEVVFGKVNLFEIGDKNSFLKAIENTKNKQFEIIPKKDFSIQNTIQNIEKIYENVSIRSNVSSR